MSRHKRGAKQADSHVRLYDWEMACPAYRTLSADARALLVEYRSLYSGKRNYVFLSVRQAQSRLNAGQRRVQNACKELEERGWIRMIEKGGFSHKTKRATAHALTNVPLEVRDGAVAPKDYMRWKPGISSVAAPATASSQDGYSADLAPSKKNALSSQNNFCAPEESRPTVAAATAQISYQWVPADMQILLTALSACVGVEKQRELMFWALLARTRATVSS